MHSSQSFLRSILKCRGLRRLFILYPKTPSRVNYSRVVQPFRITIDDVSFLVTVRRDDDSANVEWLTGIRSSISIAASIAALI
jgi:hypothetical protein